MTWPRIPLANFRDSLIRLFQDPKHEDQNPNLQPPVGFRPDERFLDILIKEGHFRIYEEHLELDWSKLKLEDVFSGVKECLCDPDNQANPAILEDLPIILTVSKIFRLEPVQEWEEWAVISGLKAMDEQLGYNTECGDYCFGMKFKDLERSYRDYSARVSHLPEFRSQLGEILGVVNAQTYFKWIESEISK